MNGIPPEYLNQIVTGDARELAKRLPDKCARLAFADPPYWVGYKYGDKTDADFEYIDPNRLVNEMMRVSGVACITPGIGNIGVYPKPDWVLGWFKFGSTRRNSLGGFNVWEPVFVYGKPAKPFWNDAINLPDIVNHTTLGDFHSCPKPEALLRWIIDGMTESGDMVIDFMCGSGTTPAMSKALGRQWIGFEIDPDTAERARQRVAATQPPLFVMQHEQMDLL